MNGSNQVCCVLNKTVNTRMIVFRTITSFVGRITMEEWDGIHDALLSKPHILWFGSVFCMLLCLNAGGGVLDIVLFPVTGVIRLAGEVCDCLGEDDKEFTRTAESRVKNDEGQ